MPPPDAAAATLSYLQTEIEGINAVSAPPVLGYLLERDGARAAGSEPRSPEELLVAESEDGIDVGLFLDEGVMSAAAAASEHRGRPRLLGRSGREGIASAAEGVSHFVYLVTRAGAGQRVSQLELEVQAEVDKFALFLLRAWRGASRRSSGLSAGLRHRLYEEVRFLAHLDEAELERYRTANQLAAGYARWLELRFVSSGDREGLLRELRATYRLGTADKPGYLASRA
jgi:hypothetical protein